MVQVSKRKLSENLLAKLFVLFFKTVGDKYSREEFKNICDDIFSKTEQLVIAKRIAIYYLLKKGVDQSSICNTLKVSSATVAKFSLIMEKSKGLVPFLDNLIKKEKIVDFLEDIFAEVISTNWRSKFRHRWEKNIKDQTGI